VRMNPRLFKLSSKCTLAIMSESAARPYLLGLWFSPRALHVMIFPASHIAAMGNTVQCLQVPNCGRVPRHSQVVDLSNGLLFAVSATSLIILNEHTMRGVPQHALYSRINLPTILDGLLL
jgi:hypothetical protein